MIDQPLGLKVNLLKFQRQSVSWMVEMEKQGAQRHLWTEVLGPDGSIFYASAPLRTVQTSPPDIVRGGFLCEEMGLGKTVICLSLILVNPADPSQVSPEASSQHTSSPTTTQDPSSSVAALAAPPSSAGLQASAAAASGELPPGWQCAICPTTHAAYYFNQVDRQPQWERPVNAAPHAPHATTNDSGVAPDGPINSCGTLVVVAVSLVSQWISEAKKKLTGDQTIYAYHGGSRNRNPEFLSSNDIVVTTYAVLGSDKNYW